jgi:N-acetyl-anhydromuramyl-L-alanine amidase AmpD
MSSSNEPGVAGGIISGMFFRANHAGHSVWQQTTGPNGVPRVGANHFSVGIEIVHSDKTPPATGSHAFRRFTKEQYVALVRLLGELVATYPIRAERVVGHNQVNVENTDGSQGKAINLTYGFRRRECPGGFFDWQLLEDAKVALAALTSRPSPPPPSWGPIADHFDRLESIPEIRAGSSSNDVLILKQLLFDIGYSVARQPKTRDQLDDKFDAAMFQAVRAFQTRQFSGRRHAYRIFKTSPAPQNPPGAEYGTLDSKTIREIIKVWGALQP